MTRLKEAYNKTYRYELLESLSLSSVMEVPILKKIIVSVGAGEAIQNPKVLDSIANELALITGQKAIKTKARKSIATFKLREGMPIGVMVSLRNKYMYEFLDRLVNIVLPRVKDFRGLNRNSFDHAGNYSFGIKEQIIFPEINFDHVDTVRGLNITMVIHSKTIQHSISLLEKFNFPLKKD